MPGRGNTVESGTQTQPVTPARPFAARLRHWAIEPVAFALASALFAYAIHRGSLLPPVAAAAGAGLLLFLWPGYAVLRLVAPRSDFDLAEKVPLSFALSLAVVYASGLPAYLLHPSMPLFLILYLLLALILIAAANRRRRVPEAETTKGEGSEWSEPRFWLLETGLLPFALILAFTIFFARYARQIGPVLGGDTWFHLNYINFLGYGPNITQNCAFFKDAGPIPGYAYSTSELMQAMWARFAGLKPLAYWYQLPVLYPFLHLSALYLLAARIFRHRALALAIALIGMLSAMPMYGGMSFLLQYPYPNQLVVVVLRAILAMVATLLYSKARISPLAIALVAASASAFHVQALLGIPLYLVTLLLLGWFLRTPQQLTRGVAVVLGAWALLILPYLMLSVGHSSVSSSPLEHIYRITSRLFAVAPDNLLKVWMLQGVAVAAFLAAYGRRSPWLLTFVGATAMVLLFPANPIVATYLSRFTTTYLLRRAYHTPVDPLVGPLLWLLLPLVAVRLWERIAARSSRATLWVAFGALAVALAFVLGTNWPRADVAAIQRAANYYAKLPLLIQVSVAEALCFAFLTVLIVTRVRPDPGPAFARLLPTTRRGVLLLVIGLVALLIVNIKSNGANLGKLPPDARSNSPTAWNKCSLPVDPETHAPLFLEFIAKDAPPRTTVIFSPPIGGTDYFISYSAGAFTNQWVMYYGEHANPTADLPARKRDSQLMVSPRAPVELIVQLLRKYDVGYIAVVKEGGGDRTPFSAHPEAFRVVHEDSGARVYTLKDDASIAASIRRQSAAGLAGDQRDRSQQQHNPNQLPGR